MKNVKRIIYDIEREREREEKYIDNQLEGPFLFLFSEFVMMIRARSILSTNYPISYERHITS